MYKTKETEREKYLETGKQLEAGSNCSHEINHPDLQKKKWKAKPKERKQSKEIGGLGLAVSAVVSVLAVLAVLAVSADGVVA